MRGKYAPLHRHLSNLEGTECSTTFHEIEAILGAELPYSAHTYQEWWSPNDHTHSHARAWMAAEWEPVNVNLRAETVVFRRTRTPTPRPVATPAIRPSRQIDHFSSPSEKASSRMTTIERPNRDALNRALDVYRDAMRAFIIRYLNRFKREHAERYIRHSLGDRRYEEFSRRLSQNSNHIEATIDVNDFPSLLGNPYRANVFGQSLKYDRVVGDNLHWVAHARNRAAHPGTQDIEPKYAEISMSCIAEVLVRINAPEERRMVESIRDRLISIPEPPRRKPESPLRPPKPAPLRTRETPTAFEFHDFMTRLSRSRPVFHSEADLQHSIESLIQETMPDYPVRLMHQLPHEDRSMYLDVWLPADGIAIQLRHATQKLELDWDDVSFELKAHGAQDLTRYDLLRDIQRLEHALARSDMCKTGLAILLTNDLLYWKSPHRAGTIDAAFRIHEGRELTGELAWAAHAGAGTTRSREAPIRLEGSYTMHWQDYSNFAGEKYGEFRYLAVAVQ